MSTAAQNEPRIASVEVTGEEIIASLVDGRRISGRVVCGVRIPAARDRSDVRQAGGCIRRDIDR